MALNWMTEPRLMGVDARPQAALPAKTSGGLLRVPSKKHNRKWRFIRYLDNCDFQHNFRVICEVSFFHP